MLPISFSTTVRGLGEMGNQITVARMEWSLATPSSPSTHWPHFELAIALQNETGAARLGREHQGELWRLENF